MFTTKPYIKFGILTRFWTTYSVDSGCLVRVKSFGRNPEEYPAAGARKQVDYGNGISKFFRKQLDLGDVILDGSNGNFRIPKVRRVSVFLKALNGNFGISEDLGEETEQQSEGQSFPLFTQISARAENHVFDESRCIRESSDVAGERIVCAEVDEAQRFFISVYGKAKRECLRRFQFSEQQRFRTMSNLLTDYISLATDQGIFLYDFEQGKLVSELPGDFTFDTNRPLWLTPSGQGSFLILDQRGTDYFMGNSIRCFSSRNGLIKECETLKIHKPIRSIGRKRSGFSECIADIFVESDRVHIGDREGWLLRYSVSEHGFKLQYHLHYPEVTKSTNGIPTNQICSIRRNNDNEIEVELSDNRIIEVEWF